ncbi:unnamed protein product [Amoebophrya sp. A120]|nr:unnamed protein product [Amoebophrya sp. A120]|eukprot:GSA120T00018229001.1
MTPDLFIMMARSSSAATMCRTLLGTSVVLFTRGPDVFFCGDKIALSSRGGTTLMGVEAASLQARTPEQVHAEEEISRFFTNRLPRDKHPRPALLTTQPQDSNNVLEPQPRRGQRLDVLSLADEEEDASGVERTSLRPRGPWASGSGSCRRSSPSTAGRRRSKSRAASKHSSGSGPSPRPLSPPLSSRPTSAGGPSPPPLSRPATPALMSSSSDSPPTPTYPVGDLEAYCKDQMYDAAGFVEDVVRKIDPVRDMCPAPPPLRTTSPSVFKVEKTLQDAPGYAKVFLVCKTSPARRPAAHNHEEGVGAGDSTVANGQGDDEKMERAVIKHAPAEEIEAAQQMRREIGTMTALGLVGEQDDATTFTSSSSYSTASDADPYKNFKDHLVKMTGCFSGTPCTFALEFCDMRDLYEKILADWKAKRRLTAADRNRYLAELLKAVHFMHTKGVAHRDISPDNVLLTSTNVGELPAGSATAKLSDFGMACSIYERVDVDDIKDEQGKDHDQRSGAEHQRSEMLPLKSCGKKSSETSWERAVSSRRNVGPTRSRSNSEKPRSEVYNQKQCRGSGRNLWTFLPRVSLRCLCAWSGHPGGMTSAFEGSDPPNFCTKTESAEKNTQMRTEIRKRDGFLRAQKRGARISKHFCWSCGRRGSIRKREASTCAPVVCRKRPRIRC